MEKYAKIGASEIARAIGFVLDYFGMDKKSFIKRHFKGSADILNLATSSESFQRIVESLENPFQQAIVADEKDSNMLILAGRVLENQNGGTSLCLPHPELSGSVRNQF